MSNKPNIQPLGGPEAVHSPMLAQAFALLAEMPADYLAAMLPVLSTYVPQQAPLRAAPPLPRGLTIHWARDPRD